ncbi:hypothetical protein BDA96_06G157400 [Sorghum bicolor]|uniref:Late embryogenesis abundant protein LEA-2 subgroup domain-containing protein n=1 Tax=Sorghum bicolor TaxID=4558 RepID=A0A921QRQ4_SORBI|nr:hypothetical protein BDA96_06G157400 [Sorghum bicolor]
MAATPSPPHTVVVCPPSRHVSSSQRRRDRNRNPDHRKTCRRVCLISAAMAVLITGCVLLVVFLSREFPTGDPVFSVAVTGVAGLDPARDLSSASAFNLTLHIDNTRNSRYRACVPELSTAAVSYGDAVLAANGTVPAFCAKEKRESERVAARAWGDAVAVPRFLRDQMADELAAGEAEVDVKVTMPRYSALGTCGDAVLSCKAKIGVGAGPSPPCRLDYVKTCYDDNSKRLPPVMFTGHASSATAARCRNYALCSARAVMAAGFPSAAGAPIGHR